MKKLKNLLIIGLLLFSYQSSFAQGCESPGEGDGIKIFGFFQPQYDYNFLGEDFAVNKDIDQSGFSFQRARIGFMGNIPYDFSYYFMTEFSKERGIGLSDAFVTYNRYSWLKASAGLFKSAFGLEQSTGCHKLSTIYRSDVVNELAGPIRDYGILFFGSTGKKKILGLTNKDLLTYSFAITNGEARLHADENNRMSYVTRIGLNPFKFIKVGASYRYGNLPAQVNTAEEDDYGTKIGFDIQLDYKNFVVSGEFITAEDVGSFTTGGGCSGEPLVVHEGSVERQGYYVMALYKTPWNLEPVFRYETYDSNLDLEGDLSSTMTFGINYFFNEWTRLQVNYLYRAEETAAAEIPNDILSIQMQAIIK